MCSIVKNRKRTMPMPTEADLQSYDVEIYQIAPTKKQKLDASTNELKNKIFAQKEVVSYSNCYMSNE